MVLTLTYNSFDNSNLLPTSDVEISNLGFTINYVQDGNALVNEDGSTPYRRMYEKYNVGETFTISGEGYYVISDSEYNEYVTLLKAEPLTVDEVHSYGLGTAYNYNGYGVMRYYTSETCGNVNGSWVETGCTTDYNQSEVKHVVDAWSRAKFTSGELSDDSNGYEARLITISELERLGYVYNSSSGYYPKNDNIPSWIWNSNYGYWTMSPYNNSSSYIWIVNYNGYVKYGNVFNSYGAVRPVINVYKSRL